MAARRPRHPYRLCGRAFAVCAGMISFGTFKPVGYTVLAFEDEATARAVLARLNAGGFKDDDVLVASGVSCRHQVADFTSARALHPAELLGALVQETA